MGGVDNIKWSNVIPILGGLFLVYGYVYLRFYYSVFGLQVHDFFSLEDYLRANIDNIYQLGVSFLLAFVYGLLSGQPSGDGKKGSRLSTLFTYLMIAFLWFLATTAIKDRTRFQWYALALIGSWLEFGIPLLPKKLADWSHELPRPLFIALVAIIPTTFMWVIPQAYYNAHGIMEQKGPGSLEPIFKEEYVRQTKVNARDLTMIGSNSKYLFFYDRKKCSTYVVPADSIITVVMKKTG